MTPRAGAATLLRAPLLAAGCSGGDSGDEAGGELTGLPIELQDGGPVHVHGLGYDAVGNVLYIATHTGMFALKEGASKAERIGYSHQDTMGLSLVKPRLCLDELKQLAKSIISARERDRRDASAGERNESRLARGQATLMLNANRKLRTSCRVRVAARWLVAVAALAAVGVAGADSHQSGHDLGHRADDARGRAAEAGAQEQALAGDIAAQSDRIGALESDIDGMRGEVSELQRRLDASKTRLRALENQLREKTRTLKRAGQQLNIAQRHLSQRVVEIYTSDTPDAVSVVLGAESLDDLVDLLEMHSRIVENDASMIGQIEALRGRVTRERARTATLRQRQAEETSRIERDTNDRQGVLAGLVARRDSLADVRAARQRTLESVQVQRREWEAQADALEVESRRVASVIAASPPATPDVQTATPSSAAPSSSGFVWPVRGTLVSPYGQRWGRLHAGIDIAAPAGTPIVAAASGQVIYADSMSGYGLMVVVQHAGGIATAYAHNSSIAVSVGESVGQGQTIAAVGCTGHCFGDHVHFEVRVGGSPVDPMAYL